MAAPLGDIVAMLTDLVAAGDTYAQAANRLGFSERTGRRIRNLPQYEVALRTAETAANSYAALEPQAEKKALNSTRYSTPFWTPGYLRDLGPGVFQDRWQARYPVERSAGYERGWASSKSTEFDFQEPAEFFSDNGLFGASGADLWMQEATEE